MANRIPIVVDAALLRFEELQIGDNLNLTSNDIININDAYCVNLYSTDQVNTGIVSCLQIQSGIFTGSDAFITNITNQNASITNLISGIVTATTVRATSGIITDIIGIGATFTGNVSIGGTLDATTIVNVDSVGVITARSGVLIGPPLSPTIRLNPDGTSLFTSQITGQNLNLSGVITSYTSVAIGIFAENVSAYGTISAPTFNTTSDVILKTDITKIENAIETINYLNPVSWKWKNNEKKSHGLIAQDVQNILPEVVDNSQEYLSINYIALIGYIIKALQELDKKISKY